MRNNPSLLRKIVEKVMNVAFLTRFPGSNSYWNLRYKFGGTSGAGSYGEEMAHKSQFLIDFISENNILSVIDFGCGDGNQLSNIQVSKYVGFDVSDVAIRQCRVLYAKDPTKDFRNITQYDGERAQLALSLDVIYHLVEDALFDEYLARLFAAADQYIIIYSSNDNSRSAHQSRHVYHRCFVEIALERFPSFQLKSAPLRSQTLGGALPGRASFFVFERV